VWHKPFFLDFFRIFTQSETHASAITTRRAQQGRRQRARQRVAAQANAAPAVSRGPAAAGGHRLVRPLIRRGRAVERPLALALVLVLHTKKRQYWLKYENPYICFISYVNKAHSLDF
jgi:hypothetical protein